MFYLKNIKTGKYVDIVNGRTGLTVRWRTETRSAVEWSTIEGAAHALATLENLGAIGRMTTTIVKED